MSAAAIAVTTAAAATALCVGAMVLRRQGRPAWVVGVVGPPLLVLLAGVAAVTVGGVGPPPPVPQPVPSDWCRVGTEAALRTTEVLSALSSGDRSEIAEISAEWRALPLDQLTATAPAAAEGTAVAFVAAVRDFDRVSTADEPAPAGSAGGGDPAPELAPEVVDAYWELRTRQAELIASLSGCPAPR